MIQVGDILHVDHGVWSPLPDSYLYTFYRVDKNGLNPVLIVGPRVSPDYTVLTADFGSRIMPEVTATNSAGSTSRFGAPSSIVGSPVVGGTPTGLQPWQYGQSMPAWLRVNGTEIANWGRTQTYLDAGLAGPGVTLESYDACSILFQDDNGNLLTFTNPTADPAPWFDAGRSESTQFLGLVVNDVQVSPQEARQATILPGRFGGTALSPTTSGGIQISVSATLVAASSSGLDYGEEWLRGMLSDPFCDPCGTDTVEFRRTCPPGDGSNPQLGYWIAYNTGLTASPTMGTRDPAGKHWDVTWTWTSEEPALYKQPTLVAPATIIDPSDVIGAHCITFNAWLCGPGSLVGCYTIEPPQSGAWGSIVTIQGGTRGVGAVEFDLYSNCPANFGVDTPDSSLLVNEVEAGCQLVIDSSQHTVTHVDAAGVVTDGLDHLFVPAGQPLIWLEVADCDPPKCVCISTPHPCSGGGSSTVQFDLQYRRR